MDDNNDIMLITDSGVIIRIPADQISQQSRYAGGVKVMKVDNETSIIGIAAVEKEEEAESDDTTPTEENGSRANERDRFWRFTAGHRAGARADRPPAGCGHPRG